jgi:hypothetical protein
VEEQRRDHRGDRDAEDRAGDARDLGPDDHRGQNHDRMDAHRPGHQPRLEDVHRHEPADAHQDEHGQHGTVGGERGRGNRRQPRQERAEERDHVQQARGDGREGRVRQPEHDVDQRRERAEHQAHDQLAAQEPAERAPDRDLQHPRLGHERRRNEPVQEREDVLAVERDVDRQDHEQQHVADHADAREGDRLERPHELPRPVLQVGDDRGDLAHEVHRQPERRQPRLDVGEQDPELGLEFRARLQELIDRGIDRRRRLDEDPEQQDHDRQVHDDHRRRRRHSRHPRHEVDQRQQRERQQPGEEEQQQDVAKGVEHAAREADHDERERDDGQDQDRVEEPPLALREDVIGHGRSLRRRDPRWTTAGQRRPIFARTSSIVAIALGLRRSAPCSRIPSISDGFAISSA